MAWIIHITQHTGPPPTRHQRPRAGPGTYAGQRQKGSPIAKARVSNHEVITGPVSNYTIIQYWQMGSHNPRENMKLQNFSHQDRK